MIDYVCKYTPVEILAGFGIESAPVDPVTDFFDEADKLTHRNICSFSRALIEKRLTAGRGALLLTDCCDSIRRACDVLREKGQDVFFLNLPHKDEHCGKQLYKNELMKFIEDLAAYSGRKFDSEKFRSACVSACAEQKREVPGGPYVSLMGARMSPELLDRIKKMSPLPVLNTTCTGIRRIGKPPPTDDTEQLMEWYASELLSQPPCMRMTDISSRKELTADPNIKGLIYNTVSFCDFYGFEYAQIKQIVSVPIVKIETDQTPQSAAQLKNRLEAFFENLNALPEVKGLSRVSFGAGSGYAESRYVAGIDSGSTSTNAVILDKGRNIVSFSTIPTGVSVAESANRAFDGALKKAGLSKAQVGQTVSTGYGRAGIDFSDREVTEITCHAKGAYFLNPLVRTVIDIGGQDSKVIRLDENGAVKDFAMNDKCAAGTGRFLEMMAQSLGITLDEISRRGLAQTEEIRISSMCSVFAQSEVVSLIAAGKKLEDIVHGLDLSVASKVISLSGRTGLEREYMITGGVAKNMGVVRAIEKKIGSPVCLPEEPEICGALGAALIALEDVGRSRA